MMISELRRALRDIRYGRNKVHEVYVLSDSEDMSALYNLDEAVGLIDEVIVFIDEAIWMLSTPLLQCDSTTSESNDSDWVEAGEREISSDATMTGSWL